MHIKYDASENSFELKHKDENYCYLKSIYQSIEKNDYDKFVQLYPEYLEKYHDYFSYWEPNLGQYIKYHPSCKCYQSYNEKEGNLERVHKGRYSLRCNCRSGKKFLMSRATKKNIPMFNYVMNYDDINIDF